MRSCTKIVVVATVAVCAATTGVYAKSAKRGVCWSESGMKLNARHASLMSPGVSWVYNWGPDATNSSVYTADMSFAPMAWNAAYNVSRLRAWLAAHPESPYLLGFNEPNFADQARMSPAQAVAAWPGLEALAAEFDIPLVAPALNFSNSQVGGRVWSPYEWYDEFFRLRPDARVDFLAMHCYMNWYTAHTWLATEYFYADLYNPSKECYGRYPNLVAFLDRYRAANGHFPRMIISEFCSWENDGTIKNVDFQIDQMTQKVQKMEQSDLVEAYAWFIGNNGGGASAYPYMSVFERNNVESDLSTLGKVYVHMSTFDASMFYAPGTVIAAKDYVEATTDNRIIRVRPNTEPASDVPLQIEIPSGGYPEYQINVPTAGEYRFTFHISAATPSNLALYVDNHKSGTTRVTDSAWSDVTVNAVLTAGHHRIKVCNAGSNPITMNTLRFDATGDVADIVADKATLSEVVTASGVVMRETDIDRLAPGVYIVRYDDGTTAKILR